MQRKSTTTILIRFQASFFHKEGTKYVSTSKCKFWKINMQNFNNFIQTVLKLDKQYSEVINSEILD